MKWVATNAKTTKTITFVVELYQIIKKLLKWLIPWNLQLVGRLENIIDWQQQRNYYVGWTKNNFKTEPIPNVSKVQVGNNKTCKCRRKQFDSVWHEKKEKNKQTNRQKK
jgi:hypothetical protein